jgi:hypothetical protein
MVVIVQDSTRTSLGRRGEVGPDTAFVSPFDKRERALSTIGNTLGLIENKNFPMTQDRASERNSFSRLDLAKLC